MLFRSEKIAGIQAQQSAQQQMKQTASANAAAATADNAMVAQVKAEKQKPGFQQDKGLLRRAAAKGIHESTYDKLNAVFENMLLTEAESISSFLSSWITRYTGLRLSDPSNQELVRLINDVQSTWGKDRGKAALYQLAKAAYALSYRGTEYSNAMYTPPSVEIGRAHV